MQAERDQLGRRCDLGCESWPDEMIYAKCPKCGEKTTRYNNLDPLDPEEAAAIKLRYEFEAYYEKRCAKLGIPTDGPLPKEYELSLPAPRSVVG